MSTTATGTTFNKADLQKVIQAHGLVMAMSGFDANVLGVMSNLNQRLQMHIRAIPRIKDEEDFYSTKYADLRTDLVKVGKVLGAALAAFSGFAATVNEVAGELDEGNLEAIDRRIALVKSTFAEIAPIIRPIAIRDGVKDFTGLLERYGSRAIQDVLGLAGQAADGLAGLFRDGMSKVKEAFGGSDASEPEASPKAPPPASKPSSTKKSPSSASPKKKQPRK